MWHAMQMEEEDHKIWLLRCCALVRPLVIHTCVDMRTICPGQVAQYLGCRECHCTKSIFPELTSHIFVFITTRSWCTLCLYVCWPHVLWDFTDRCQMLCFYLWEVICGSCINYFEIANENNRESFSLLYCILYIDSRVCCRRQSPSPLWSRG